MKRLLPILLILIVAAALWWFASGPSGGGGPSAPEGERGAAPDQPAPLVGSAAPEIPPPPPAGPPPELTGEDPEWKPDPNGLPLAGWVLTESGEPIPGVKVRIYRRTDDGYSWPPSPVSGRDGSFRVEGLSKGLWTLYADAPLRRPFWEEGIETGRTDLVLTLPPGADLTVRALVPEGMVVSDDAAVQYTADRWLDTERRYERAQECVTDTRESTFGRLSTGRYRVEVRVVGAGRGGVSDIAVKVGEATVVEVPIEEGAVIEGRVITDGKGEPVGGALVVVGRKDEGIPPLYVMNESSALVNNRIPARTDDDGSFRIPGLVPGPHDLAVRADGYTPFSARGVSAATEAKPVEIRLSPGGAVAFLVLDRDGAPEHEAWVSADFGEDGEFEARTDESGRALIRGLPPGESEVGAFTFTWSTTAVVRVAAGETTQVTLRPPPGDAALSGTISRAGRPQPDRHLSARFTGGSGRQVTLRARTGADGKYRIEGLPRGKVQVEITGLRGFQQNLGERLLQPGRNTFDIDLPDRSIRLHVIDAETRKAAAHARIYRDGWWFENADAEGIASLEELPDTPQELLVFAPPRLGFRRVTVRPVRNPPETVVALPRAAGLVVTFVDGYEREIPLGDVEFELLDAEGHEVGESVRIEDHEASAEGRAIFSLPPGAYKLVAGRKDGPRETREIRLYASGEEVYIVLR